MTADEIAEQIDAIVVQRSTTTIELGVSTPTHVKLWDQEAKLWLAAADVVEGRLARRACLAARFYAEDQARTWQTYIEQDPARAAAG